MPAKILITDDETDLELLIGQRFRRQILRIEATLPFLVTVPAGADVKVH